MQPKHLSLAITNYNRYGLLMEALSEVLTVKEINEILVQDDCSNSETQNKLANLPKFNSKIFVNYNIQNAGMYKNKFLAVLASKNPWVVLFDSDNIIYPDYIKSLYDNVPIFRSEYIYMPSMAYPNFDYSQFAGQVIDIAYIKRNSENNMLWTMLNTCNYVVPRNEYCEVFEAFADGNIIKETDTLYFNYLWLKSGRKFYVVPQMKYFHRVHQGSGWMQNAAYNMKMAESFKQHILSL